MFKWLKSRMRKPTVIIHYHVANIPTVDVAKAFARMEMLTL